MKLPTAALAAAVAAAAAASLLLPSTNTPDANRPNASPPPHSNRSSTRSTPTTRYTGAHVRRVATYALILADAAGLDEHEQRIVERVALFHDIGKIHEALFDIIHDDSAPHPRRAQGVATHPQRGADVLAPLAGFYPDLPEGRPLAPRALGRQRLPARAQGHAASRSPPASSPSPTPSTPSPTSAATAAASRSSRRCDSHPRGSRRRSSTPSWWTSSPSRRSSSDIARRRARACRAGQEPVEASAARREDEERGPRHHLPLASWAKQRARAAPPRDRQTQNRALIAATPLAPGRAAAPARSPASCRRSRSPAARIRRPAAPKRSRPSASSARQLAARAEHRTDRHVVGAGDARRVAPPADRRADQEAGRHHGAQRGGRERIGDSRGCTPSHRRERHVGPLVHHERHRGHRAPERARDLDEHAGRFLREPQLHHRRATLHGVRRRARSVRRSPSRSESVITTSRSAGGRH